MAVFWNSPDGTVPLFGDNPLTVSQRPEDAVAGVIPGREPGIHSFLNSLFGAQPGSGGYKQLPDGSYEPVVFASSLPDDQLPGAGAALDVDTGGDIPVDPDEEFNPLMDASASPPSKFGDIRDGYNLYLDQMRAGDPAANEAAIWQEMYPTRGDGSVRNSDVQRMIESAGPPGRKPSAPEASAPEASPRSSVPRIDSMIWDMIKGDYFKGGDKVSPPPASSEPTPVASTIRPAVPGQSMAIPPKGTPGDYDTRVPEPVNTQGSEVGATKMPARPPAPTIPQAGNELAGVPSMPESAPPVSSGGRGDTGGMMRMQRQRAMEEGASGNPELGTVAPQTAQPRGTDLISEVQQPQPQQPDPSLLQALIQLISRSNPPTSYHPMVGNAALRQMARQGPNRAAPF